MNTARYISCIMLGLSVAACAHHPRHYSAPDSTKLDASAQRLHTAVTGAKATHKEVTAAVAEVKTKVADEKAHLDLLEPKLNELFRIAPAELRDEIDAARKEAAAIRADNTGLLDQVANITALQSKEGSQLEEANAADKQHLADKEAFKTEVDTLAARANAAEQGWAKDSKALAWYRLHWWGAWIVAGLGVIACLVIAFFKATGRLALTIPKL